MPVLCAIQSSHALLGNCVRPMSSRACPSRSLWLWQLRARIVRARLGIRLPRVSLIELQMRQSCVGLRIRDIVVLRGRMRQRRPVLAANLAEWMVVMSDSPVTALRCGLAGSVSVPLFPTSCCSIFNHISPARIGFFVHHNVY